MLLAFNLQAQEPEQKQQLNLVERVARNEAITLPRLETLTLDEALTYALEHSPKIKEAQINVALAEIDLKRTRWWNWFAPSLTLHQGYNPALAESRMGVGISFDLNKILGGGYREGKQSRLKFFDAEIYLTKIKQDVIASVTKSYYDFVIAKKNIEILEDQLENSVKLQEILKLKFESGQAQISQLLNLAESIANTKLALLKAQAEAKLTELVLRQAMGYESTDTH
jgi:outer membrane protein TolC